MRRPHKSYQKIAPLGVPSYAVGCDFLILHHFSLAAVWWRNIKILCSSRLCKKSAFGHSFLCYVLTADTADQREDKDNPDDGFPINAADAVAKVA